LLILGLGLWFADLELENSKELIRDKAKNYFMRDMDFRLWASQHGGFYVPPSEHTPPNPHLEHVPDRDIETLSGKKLTLMNPAYMLRQMMEDRGDKYNARARITSLNPLRPENKADNWERKSLESFEDGLEEVGEFTVNDGEPYFRYMRPMLTQESCLKCHAHQGYKVGDIRGGVSVTVYAEPYFMQARKQIKYNSFILGLLWLLGFIGIFVNTAKVRSHVRKQKEIEDELRLSNNALSQERNMFVTGPVVVFKWRNEENWPIDYVSANVEEVFGVSAADLCSGLISYASLIPEEDLEQVGTEVAEALAKELTSFAHLPYRIKRSDKKVIWVNDFTTVIRNSWGDVTHFLGYIVDITEQKEAEEKLISERQRLANIIQSTRTATWEWNVLTGSTIYNERWAEMLGYTLDELYPISIKTREKFSHPEDYKNSLAELQKYFKKEIPYYDCEYRLKHKDGHWVWIHDRGKVTNWTDDGKPLMMFGTHSDINARKLMELEREQAHGFMQSVIDCLPEGLMVINLDYSIALANKAAEKGAKKDPDGLKTRYCYKLSHGEETPCSGNDHVCPLQEVLKAKETISVVHNHLDSEGRSRTIEIIAAPVFNEKGEVVQIIESSRDVTERIILEEKKISLERQVLHAQKLESLGVLAGGIAHDFNNLLMAILGNADLALYDISPLSPAVVYINEVIVASKRATDLAKQMLAYSGKGSFLIGPINIVSLVEEMAHLLEVSISKNVVLKYDLKDDLPMIDGDVTQIRQIVMNLIINASEAIGEKSGFVTLSNGIEELSSDYMARISKNVYPPMDAPHPAGNYVYFMVSDDGVGMSKETEDKIFDPFFTTKFTGRGLGMSAVLGIVRCHKGVIQIRSEIGQGTSFKILFPIGKQDAEEPKNVQIDAEEKEWNPQGTILVADDESTILKLAKRMLVRLGFSVLTAADGREAFNVYKQNHAMIDCVLLDFTMPHMNGQETFAEIRRINPDAKVVLCSGYNEQDATERFNGKGLSGFIQKPFTMDVLKNTLWKILV
jgi:two-component system, cell cycle sensor histidine kinase and response regulator CckA